MNMVRLRQSMSRSGGVILPVRQWKNVQFNLMITRKQIETTSVRLLCHRRISEAHAIRTANVAFGQSGPSSRQGSHSRARVRFHTTANIRG